jgi:hypothetical protein
MTAALPAQTRLHPDGTLAQGHRFVIVEPSQALPCAIRYTAWDLQFGDTCEILEHTYGPWADRQQGRNDFVLRGSQAAAAAHIAAAAMEHARAVGRSKHPSHLRLRAVWRENGTVYVATDAPQGVPLPAQPTPAWRWRDCEPVFRQILEALQELHALGTYHGGLGAHCLFVRADGLPELRLGDVRLSDRGTAMAVADAAEADLADFANTVIRLFGPAGHRVGAATGDPSRRAALVAAGLSDGWADAVVALRSHPSPGTVGAFLATAYAASAHPTIASRPEAALGEVASHAALSPQESPAAVPQSKLGRAVSFIAIALLLVLFTAKLIQSGPMQEAGSGADEASVDDVVTWRPDGTPDPAAFAFVVHEGTESYLILGPGSENTAATAPPELLTGFGNAFQPLNGAGELGAWEPWLGKDISMFGPKSECSAKVGSIGNLARFDGGEDGLVGTDAAPDGIDRLSDTRLAELTFEHAGDNRFIAARLVNTSGTGCDQTLWARHSDLPPLAWRLPQDTDRETAATFEGELRASPAWAETQQEYVEWSAPFKAGGDQAAYPRDWESYQPGRLPRQFKTLSIAGSPMIAWGNINAGGGGCGGFEGSLTGIWLRDESNMNWSLSSPPATNGYSVEPTVIFDLGQDGSPEILFGTGDYLQLFRRVDGVFKPVLEHEVADYGCPC